MDFSHPADFAAFGLPFLSTLAAEAGDTMNEGDHMRALLGSFYLALGKVASDIPNPVVKLSGGQLVWFSVTR
jgi:hypothetical protein